MPKPNHKETPSKKKPLKQYNSYTQYSALGIQLIVIILAGLWGGRMLDRYIDFKFPLFTVSLTIISAAFSIYYLIYSLTRKP